MSPWAGLIRAAVALVGLAGCIAITRGMSNAEALAFVLGVFAIGVGTTQIAIARGWRAARTGWHREARAAWNAIGAVFGFAWEVVAAVFAVAVLGVFVAYAHDFIRGNTPNNATAITVEVAIMFGVVLLSFCAHAAERIPLWSALAAGISGSEDGSPPGRYLGWPLPVLVVTLTLGLIPAIVYGSRNPLVFAVVVALNPVLWFAVCPLWHLGRMRCPHCRRSASMASVRDAAVGSPLVCPRCNNVVSKPAG